MYSQSGRSARVAGSNGEMGFQLGMLKTSIVGGPYRNKPADYIGVKMAKEIPLPCFVDVPTVDFSVPDVAEFKRGLMQAIMAMTTGKPLYVGCMGGIGRTGLFLAGLAKIQIEYRKFQHRAGRGEDPVLYVRDQYIPHAVETKQQQEYIKNLDVSDIVRWWSQTQPLMYKVNSRMDQTQATPIPTQVRGESESLVVLDEEAFLAPEKGVTSQMIDEEFEKDVAQVEKLYNIEPQASSVAQPEPVAVPAPAPRLADEEALRELGKAMAEAGFPVEHCDYQYISKKRPNRLQRWIARVFLGMEGDMKTTYAEVKRPDVF